jgi:pyruvate/2-oxoglutarate dehydrogenase complex dihydrolipoamide dehydrogenase (E3) component
MTTERHYDAIVIGSGQGGKPLAGALAHARPATHTVTKS